jgi:hypothetical protein
MGKSITDTDLKTCCCRVVFVTVQQYETFLSPFGHDELLFLILQITSKSTVTLFRVAFYNTSRTVRELRKIKSMA